MVVTCHGLADTLLVVGCSFVQVVIARLLFLRDLYLCLQTILVVVLLGVAILHVFQQVIYFVEEVLVVSGFALVPVMISFLEVVLVVVVIEPWEIFYL